MARLCVLAVLFCLSAVTQADTLLGGRSKVDVNSPEVKQALKLALYEYNMRSNDMYQARAVNVRQAEKQIVSGIMYYLDVDVGRTQCKKPTTDAGSCKLHADPDLAKVTTCHFAVHTIPWLSKSALKSLKCE